MVLPISILGIHFAYISFLLHLTNLRQAFRLSGTTFVKMVCIQFVNPSIPFYFNHTPPPSTIYNHSIIPPPHLYFFLPPSLRNLLLLNILHINMSVRLVSNFIFQGIWELWVHNPLLKGPWTLGGAGEWRRNPFTRRRHEPRLWLKVLHTPATELRSNRIRNVRT